MVRFLAGGFSSFCNHIEIPLVIQVEVPSTNPLVASNIACDIVDSSGFASFAQAVEALVPVSYALGNGC